jgi:hypothetical protein
VDRVCLESALPVGDGLLSSAPHPGRWQGIDHLPSAQSIRRARGGIELEPLIINGLRYVLALRKRLVPATLYDTRSLQVV